MIPDKLINFRCYNEGETMLGIVDVELPSLEYITEGMKGAGIAGEIDIPVPGHTPSLTITINWRSLIENNLKLSAPKTYLFDFRGSMQSYDENSGEIKQQALKVVVKGIPKSVSLGKLDTATQMGTSGTYEVTYLKISIENKEVLELDKFNFIFRVGDVDYLEKVRKDLGME